jgi:hypothetical protein
MFIKGNILMDWLKDLANIVGLMVQTTRGILSKAIETDMVSGYLKMESSNIKAIIYLTESMDMEFMIGVTIQYIRVNICKI